MQTPDRVGELDGLRGLAILSVMLFHFSSNLTNAFSWGWCGVDLFFVLSGFLITGILLDSKASSNYFFVFYARRALRILPVYYFVVLTFQIVSPSSVNIWFWLHISNWYTAFHPYCDLTHFWSLAIEEQFYLVWPLVVLFCSNRRLLWVSTSLIAGCWLARNLAPLQELGAQYPNSLYRLTPFRMDPLLLGACAVLIARDSHLTALVRRHLRTIFLGGSVAIIAVIVVARDASPHSAPMTRFGYTALGLVFACAVLYAAWNAGSQGAVGKVLRNPVLRSFGKYSYAMYVFHPFMLHLHIPGSQPLTFLVRMVSTYLAAVLSWNLIEQPFLALKKRFKYKRNSGNAAGSSVDIPARAFTAELSTAK